jgi:2-phospho-L-lactate guanylyltransferase (CobY/MobA/RfbA family)
MKGPETEPKYSVLIRKDISCSMQQITSRSISCVQGDQNLATAISRLPMKEKPLCDYEVNESEHSISLHIIGGSFPAWDDSNQKRFIAINGDELTYKNPAPASGGGTAVVILKRAARATE